MKRSFFTKCLCLVLSLAMALSLAATASAEGVKDALAAASGMTNEQLYAQMAALTQAMAGIGYY